MNLNLNFDFQMRLVILNPLFKIGYLENFPLFAIFQIIIIFFFTHLSFIINLNLNFDFQMRLAILNPLFKIGYLENFPLFVIFQIIIIFFFAYLPLYLPLVRSTLIYWPFG